MTIASTVETLRKTIKKCSENSLLSAGAVTLLAACKGQSVEHIVEAIEAGVTDFGENRVQEAEGKWPELKRRFPHVHLHLIGPLQTNKVKTALELFDVIQTIDRPKLALAIANELGNWGIGELGNWGKAALPLFSSSPVLPISSSPHLQFPNSPTPQFSNSPVRQFLIQINTGKEPQKAGAMPQDADALIEYCVKKLALPVVGLMCVPPNDQPPAPHFAYLRALAEKHGLPQLSMGMSGDFETAVRMGSTCVRIGTALFGERG